MAETIVPQPPVNGPRLWASLERMAQIGVTPKGGVCRLALSGLDRESRDLFISWQSRRDAKSASMPSATSLRVAQAVGEMPPPVATGSHQRPTANYYHYTHNREGSKEDSMHGQHRPMTDPLTRPM